jgi:RimJ/RimL family protein N-acetyltransferase
MLKGEKVILRAMEREDLERLWQFNNDLEVELAGGGDPPMPQSLARLQAEFESKVSSGGRDGASFAIEADGQLIGQCSLFNFDDTAHTCELGIAIGDKAYWGKGYGREAVGLLLEYAFRYRNLRRVFLRTDGQNIRGQRAYKACGFVEEGRLRAHVYSNGAYDDLVFMGILRDEWQRTLNIK